MTYRGHVKGGVIVLDDDAGLVDGTSVVVEVATAHTESELSIGEGLAKLAGLAKGLPADIAERHDHYCRERSGQITTSGMPPVPEFRMSSKEDFKTSEYEDSEWDRE